jgi:hypothetical protein
LLLALTSGLSAQILGRITGSVIDPAGAAVAGAKVELHLAQSAAVLLSTQTNSSGEFSISSVRAAAYDISVESAGFNRATVSGVNVDPSSLTTVPAIQLEIASAIQSVEVKEAAQSVQTSNFEVSSTITQAQVENLPVLDRQVSNLFLTQPGVTSGRGQTVVDGQRVSLTNLTLDGVNIQDNFIRDRAIDFLPNKLTIGQVSEITVTSSNANPALGLGSSQIVLSTPSGGNQLHGNAYWYNRNNALSANNWFNNQAGVERPFLNLNQLGGSIGGPILKDKLFYYANYEAYRLRQTSPQLDTVLTPSAAQGILSYRDSTTGAIRQFNVLQAKGIGIDPAIQSLLGQIPGTVNSQQAGDGLNTGGYSFNARSDETRDNVTGRVDYYLSQNHIFAGSFLWNRDLIDRPDIGNFVSKVPPVSNDDNAKFLSASWRWSPTPRLTNEVRGGFNLSKGTFVVAGQSPSYFVDPTTTLFTPPVNTFLPQGRQTNTFALQDNMSYSLGRHNLAFGFQMQATRTHSYDYAGTVPDYFLGISATNSIGFNPGDIPGAGANDINTANNLLSTLGGIITQDEQSFNVTSRTSGFVASAPQSLHIGYDTYSGYFTDNWKVSRRLTVNAGVRWDHYTTLNERDSLVLLPELINNNPIATLLGNATLNFAGNSVGRPFYHSGFKNFAPNVGFAYDVFGNGKTAIRGGYGISYVNDEIITAFFDNYSFNSGLSSAVFNSNLNGTLTGSRPSVQNPPFMIPITTAQNYAINPNQAEFLVDPHLRTPYVQQWNFGIQQEVKGFIIDARYVGNHGVDGLRVFDYNQVVIKPNGFLTDFRNARANAFLAQSAGNGFDPTYNPAIKGSQPLTVFPQLVGGGFLGDPTVQGLLLSNEVGELAHIYQVDGLNGNVNFFNNPLLLGANYLSNYTSSTYNAGQLDIRRRTRAGLQFQFNYVFSKSLSDSRGNDQTRFEPFLDIASARLEKSRTSFDLTHVFKSNFYLPLPVGDAHRLSYQPFNKLLSGWGISSFITYASGTPFSVYSGRATVNRGGFRSQYNPASVNIAQGQLQNITGFFMTGNGPFFVAPGAIGTDGRGAAADGQPAFQGQSFFNPSAGNLGNLQLNYFNGPWDFNWDFAVLKSTHITERQSLDFRADFFNLTNHPAFWAGDENLSTNNFNINDPTFGRIATTFNQPRVIQFGLYYRF